MKLKGRRMWILGLVVLVVLAMAYVRLAPGDIAGLHQPVEATQDKVGKGFAVRVIAAQADTLARLDGAMMALPRTSRITGSLEEGRITYVTRSKWMGFPDYTTIEQTDGSARLFARLRFGKADFGVNAARLDRVVAVVTE